MRGGEGEIKACGAARGQDASPILQLQSMLSSMAFFITPNLRLLYVPTRLRSSTMGLITMRLRLTAEDLEPLAEARLVCTSSSSDPSLESAEVT